MFDGNPLLTKFTGDIEGQSWKIAQKFPFYDLWESEGSKYIGARISSNVSSQGQFIWHKACILTHRTIHLRAVMAKYSVKCLHCELKREIRDTWVVKKSSIFWANYNFQLPYINQTSSIRDFHQTHVWFWFDEPKLVFSGPIRQVFGLFFLLKNIRRSAGNDSAECVRKNNFMFPLVEFVHSRVDYTALIEHIVPKNILCADTNVWISSLGKISQKLWDKIRSIGP